MMDIIEFWMVGLILFRDLFMTGLRMAMERRGLPLVTSTIAKAKTATQMGIISFILIVLGLKGLSVAWTMTMLGIVREYRLIYNLTLAVTLFTLITGITYLYANKNSIQNFLEKE